MRRSWWHNDGQRDPAYLAQLIRDQRVTAARLYNCYGPTEVTVGIFTRECLAEAHAARIPIGTPEWNIRAYVLDDGLRPVPRRGAR